LALNRSAMARALVGLGVLAMIMGCPLLGWPRVVRLPAILVPALALAILVTPRQEWRDSPLLAGDWQPSRRQVAIAAAAVFLVLFWYVCTRFQSGEINAIDFTIYYDRPCFQTVHGRPLFVETSDTPGFGNRSELADHAYWGMLLVCAPYALYPTPLWLHALSAIAVVGGAVFVLRIGQRLGAGGVLAVATSLGFVLNDNTARALNYGFHPELLYACLVPWAIDAGLRGARRTFLAVTLAVVLVKEDAVLPLFAVSVALALHGLATRRGRGWSLFLVFPTAIGLANLALYQEYVVPLLTGSRQWAYAHFWAGYGDTPARALVGMITHPLRVFESTATSGVFRTVEPYLFLPFVGWRWALGTLPIVAVYGASSNEQIRAFGIYYAIVLVPFFALAASAGAFTLARRIVANEGHARLAAGAVVLLGPLLVGSGHRGYSLRPWREEVRAVPEALASLAGEPRILVQSGLFPHAGYDTRLVLLTPETLADPRNSGAALLLARRASAYPFDGKEVARLGALPSIRAEARGVAAVRLSQPVTLPPRPFHRGRARFGTRRCRRSTSRGGGRGPSCR
jgi:uncharacterized membrane protein